MNTENGCRVLPYADIGLGFTNYNQTTIKNSKQIVPPGSYEMCGTQDIFYFGDKLLTCYF